VWRLGLLTLDEPQAHGIPEILEVALRHLSHESPVSSWRAELLEREPPRLLLSAAYFTVATARFMGKF
jgi:hypothetical protein